jgi:uncharacterized protein
MLSQKTEFANFCISHRLIALRESGSLRRKTNRGQITSNHVEANLRRKEKEVHDQKQIEAVIQKADVCRLAMCEAEKPYLVPVSFGYREGNLYFHSALEGRKIDILGGNNLVCFEMEADVELLKGETPCKWSVKYLSVIGMGRAYSLEDPAEKRHGLEIVFRHYSDAPVDIPAESLDRVKVFRVTIESMTCKASGYSVDAGSLLEY